MPSANNYVPPTDVRRNEFKAEIVAERTRRWQIYRTAVAYYEGNHPDQLKVEDDEPDDNTDINMVKLTCERTASFLFPEVPEFVIDPASATDTPEEAWLKNLFEENGGLASLIKLASRGFLAGHNFVRVQPVPRSQWNTAEPTYPKITVLDPTSVTVFWRADATADVLWYEYKYINDDILYIEDIVKSADGQKWAVFTYKATQSFLASLGGVPTAHGARSAIVSAFDFVEGAFEVARPPVIHNSRIPPIIEWAHLPHPDDYYGMHEFTQQDLQDTINRIVSLRNRIVRENSDPTDVLTGADLSEIQDDGGLITIPSSTARVTRLELKGDMSAITVVLDKLMETYLAVARVVLLKGEAKDLQRVTNASVRTLFIDMLAKNSVLQSTYGAGLKRIARLALQMAYEMGAIVANPVALPVRVKFGSPLPTDMTELANINSILHNIGSRSLQTIAETMGDDWAFESEALAADNEAAMERQSQQMEMAAKFQTPPTANKQPTTT